MLEGTGVGGWGNWVMDIGEGMCCNEHWILYKTDESQTCTPKTNNALYVNFKKMEKKKLEVHSHKGVYLSMLHE